MNMDTQPSTSQENSSWEQGATNMDTQPSTSQENSSREQGATNMDTQPSTSQGNSSREQGVKMDLRMYSICAYLSSDFLKKVEKAFFLDNGFAALLLTYDEQLYAIGRVFNCCLGVGSHFKPKELVKVNFPKNIKIQDFATRGMYCTALTREGTVFHWGGSIGTPKRVHCLRDHCIIQISSGENFLMALNTNGQVWTWKGTKFSCYKIAPRVEDMVVADYSPCIIKMIGIFRPIILTKSGSIYMPKDSFTSTASPINYLTKPLEALPSHVRIAKLVCGKFRIYALSKEGALYTWNEYSCDKVVTPECVASGLGRLADIRASLDYDEVIALDHNGKLFRIVKKYGGETLWSCTELNNTSFNEYEATGNLSSYGVKELELPIETSFVSRIAQVKWFRKWMNAFNSPEDSDVTFVVEGKMIYAHQVVLSLQCQPLKRSLENEYMDESKRIIMAIENNSHSTFYRFIKFMYHGQLDIGPPQGNIELLKLVHLYEYEPLMKLCEEMVIRGIREDSACSLYSLATRLGLKELKDESLDFIRTHKEDIVKNGKAGEVAAILNSGEGENAGNQ